MLEVNPEHIVVVIWFIWALINWRIRWLQYYWCIIKWAVILPRKKYPGPAFPPTLRLSSGALLDDNLQSLRLKLPHVSQDLCFTYFPADKPSILASCSNLLVVGPH